MKFKILCLLLILTVSCNKSENEQEDSNVSMYCSIDTEVIEIIAPAENLSVYSDSLFAPIIIVKNVDKNHNIASMDIDYLIDIDNLHNGYVKGPQTRWTGTLKYGEEVTITLKDWTSTGENTPLNNGVHSVVFEISEVNDVCTGTPNTGVPIYREFLIER